MPSQGRLGDSSMAEADAHGCPACPHTVTGPATQGSPDVMINDLPALRVGDTGVHSPCCGSNSWSATEGSGTVFINNMPAHRLGDQVQHCGGVGELVEGSADVIVGD